MRTFSKLKALCSHAESLERPSARRDEAAELGRVFHKEVELWIRARSWGEPYVCHAPEPIATWFRRLVEQWNPPDNIESEVALGLENVPFPSFVSVVEDPPESHEYRPALPGRFLLTAGRADWLWTTALDDGRLCVHACDIKTTKGYLGPPRQLRQVLAQGFAAAMRAGASAFAPGIYYARAAMFDWGPVIVDGTREWEEAFADVLRSANDNGEPRPGGWCLSCWARRDCSANPVIE